MKIRTGIHGVVVIAAALCAMAATATAQQGPEGMIEDATPLPPSPQPPPAPYPTQQQQQLNPIPAASLTPPAPDAARPDAVVGPRPARPGYHWELRHPRALLYAGLGAFAGSYVPGVLTGILLNDSWYPAIPVGGSMYEGVRTFSRINDPCTGSTCDFMKVLNGVSGVLSVFEGVVQAAGIGLIITSLVIKRPAEVADEPPPVTLHPLLVPGGGGLSVRGAF